jgi:hypothetical protein
MPSRPQQFRAKVAGRTRLAKMIRSVSSSGCMSKRTSMMLEEVVKLYGFAGISPEQSFTEAGRHREAVVAAD